MITWTIADAVDQLDPPLTEAEVRALVLLYQVPVREQRRTRGRPADAYDQPALLRAHAAVIAYRRGLLHAILGPRPAAGG
ncbi:hypothetical protein MF672_010775 [Actinomadura sp. ATCC 31491]|uniref:Uncharacterized protein n=1 Tax=Actinomadura luzonensis TaxID=2805427 RepID=A0ABT0FPJ4_9ACTN|nr:hypothetical protein [Actinomadura luzonensis]MCK2214270.1 hypothetical protein [Actinomadura luzonensis]